MQSRALDRVQTTDMTALPLPLAAVWPEGLRRISGSIVLFKYLKADQFLAALRDRGVEYRTSGRETFIPFAADGVFSGFQAAATVELDEDDDYAVDIAIGPDGVAQSTRKRLDIIAFVDLLLSHVDSISDDELDMASIGRFEFSSAEWKPAIPLPIQLMGVLEDATGAPEVTGLEFKFTDESSELRRSSIATFPGSPKDIIVRLQVTTLLLPTESLFQRICDSLVKHLPLMAAPRESRKLLSETK